MDLRHYVEDSKEAWMWIYCGEDTTAVNMDHVVFIRLKGGANDVAVVATMETDDDIVLKVCNSGGEARDWLNKLLASANARGGGGNVRKLPL